MIFLLGVLENTQWVTEAKEYLCRSEAKIK